MTTISNPAGSPTFTYNRDGTTITTITGGVSGAQSDAVQIGRFSQTTVVVVHTTGTLKTPAVLLPTGADVGDVVEVLGGFTTQATQITPCVYVPSGMTANEQPYGGFSHAAAVWRYVAPNSWFLVSANG